MAKYVLLAGFHAVADKLFSPGDVVESVSDLEARWPEKFIAWTPQDDNAELPQEEGEDER